MIYQLLTEQKLQTNNFFYLRKQTNAPHSRERQDPGQDEQATYGGSKVRASLLDNIQRLRGALALKRVL